MREAARGIVVWHGAERVRMRVRVRVRVRVRTRRSRSISHGIVRPRGRGSKVATNGRSRGSVGRVTVGCRGGLHASHTEHVGGSRANGHRAIRTNGRNAVAARTRSRRFRSHHGRVERRRRLATNKEAIGSRRAAGSRVRRSGSRGPRV